MLKATEQARTASTSTSCQVIAHHRSAKKENELLHFRSQGSGSLERRTPWGVAPYSRQGALHGSRDVELGLACLGRPGDGPLKPPNLKLRSLGRSQRLLSYANVVPRDSDLTVDSLFSFSNYYVFVLRISTDMMFPSPVRNQVPMSPRWTVSACCMLHGRRAATRR